MTAGLPLGLRAYRLATGLVEPLAPCLLRRRAGRGKEDAQRLDERLGVASRPRPSGPLAWLHGASLGETLSLIPLVVRLRAERPDLTVLVTSGTVTSAELIATRLPQVIHQYAPVDGPKAASRFLDHWRPDLAIFVESEIWPNLITLAKHSGVRLALVSARLSDRSLINWAKRPKSARALFRSFSLVMAQTDTVGDALRTLGARDDGRLNLKLAGAPLTVNRAELERLRAAARDRPVLLAASTHPGEDEAVLEAYRMIADYALLVIVPRHPARAVDIVAAARAAGFTVARRTEAAFGEARVYVADTLGELGLWFSLAAAALVGGSLAPGPGGHNPVEPAQLGCPVLTGPHVDNWRDLYAALIGAGAAVVVRDPLELAAAFSEALMQPAAAQARAARARQVVAGGASGLDTAVAGLLKLLP